MQCTGKKLTHVHMGLSKANQSKVKQHTTRITMNDNKRTNS